MSTATDNQTPGTAQVEASQTAPQSSPSPSPAAQKPAKAKSGRAKEDAPYASEIAALEEKLARVKERQREAIRKQQDKNARDVRDLIKAQKWENYTVEVWQEAADSIGAALSKASQKFQ